MQFVKHIPGYSMHVVVKANLVGSVIVRGGHIPIVFEHFKYCADETQLFGYQC